jgi:hypothetical protein
LAIAAPMPREPPVTSATFSVNVDICSPGVGDDRFSTSLISIARYVDVPAWQADLAL